MGFGLRIPRTAAVLAAAAAMGLSGCGALGDGAASDESIDVAYVPVATFLPAFVAQEEGIFERNGIEVKLTAVQNLSTVPGALGRQFDIASSTPPDLIKAVDQGIDVAAVTGATTGTPEHPIGAIVVPQTSPIETVTDLVGKRVAAPTIGAAMHVSTLNWLSLEGVEDPGEALTPVEMPFSNMLDQLKAGRVDAAEVVEPFLGLALDQGYRSIGSPIESSVGSSPVLSVLWIAGSDWARDNPEAVDVWTRSLIEAEQFIQDDPERARAILQEYTELPPEVAQSLRLPTFAGGLTAAELEERLAPWVPALNRSGQFSGDIPPADLVATTAGSDS